MAVKSVDPTNVQIPSYARPASAVLSGNGSHPQRAVDYFGKNTFNDRVMREKLPKEAYKRLVEIIRKGKKLDRDLADTVAHAMKEWALENNVTHFTHWFQPMTGLTAEKHDAFLSIDADGQIIERFSGDQLIQGEPDASSFPSGGMRTTFEARGYTMWDPSSPAFILEGPRGGILCIPSVFISYNGEALDKKTPLLRSMQVLDQAARKVLELFGHHAERVISTLGPEQEYFLIDLDYYNRRPDLILANRTLIGARPPKGQEMEDHYFGSIKERVLAFMQDAEVELYKLGVPAKTRHNEVAPHQYEIAQIHAEANVAADRNQLVMEILKKVAARHGLALLLHEKPFQGVNGSGKHVNWSIMDDQNHNLLDPGQTPKENLQFLVFLVSVLRAVHRYADILRASIASAGNDHRLGANEAPPAIMSVFLGATISKILDSIESGSDEPVSEQKILDLGISNLPKILQDNTDRNRTSPFAFTGNKFEFRAVGSSASISLPATIINAAVADSLNFIHDEIQNRMQSGKDLRTATFEVLRAQIKETKPIRFEGNNYSEEWKQEAARRGLPNLPHTPAALQAFRKKENIAMLTRLGVYSESEIESRYNTKIEQFCKTLTIEVQTLTNLCQTMVIPAALEYQNRLIQNVRGLHDLKNIVGKAGQTDHQAKLLIAITEHLEKLQEALEQLHGELETVEALGDETQKAFRFAETVRPMMDRIREISDELEELIPDTFWPLPKYREMLFIM